MTIKLFRPVGDGFTKQQEAEARRAYDLDRSIQYDLHTIQRLAFDARVDDATARKAWKLVREYDKLTAPLEKFRELLDEKVLLDLRKRMDKLVAVHRKLASAAKAGQ